MMSQGSLVSSIHVSYHVHVLLHKCGIHVKGASAMSTIIRFPPFDQSGQAVESEVKMSCIAFPCEYDRCMRTREPRSLHQDIMRKQSSLHDLVGSNEVFLGHLEAIHYIGFPGW